MLKPQLTPGRHHRAPGAARAKGRARRTERPLLHYCWLAPRGTRRWNFSLAAYICARSALEHVRPRRTILWTNAAPAGEHWKKLRGEVQVRPTPVDLTSWGTKPILLGAHMADKLRLEVIHRHGGIYLDHDVLVLKPLDALLGGRLILGRCSADGLGNGVIIAGRRDPFISIWREAYEEHFEPDGWDEASVKLPHRLARRHPGLIRVLPQTAFYHPSWLEWRRVFEERDVLLPRSYAYHLWNAFAGEHLDTLTVDGIRSGTSQFDRIAREYL